ncbi:MAG: DUF5615 family PIN-like protein [Lacipirellulaceae bacterium]
MIRFHLDESVPHSVADGLIKRGIDVTTSTEAELLSAPDEVQLAHATREGRVLVTQDQDFLRIASEGGPHAGIVYGAKRWVYIGEIVRFCKRIADNYEPDDMYGRIEYVPGGPLDDEL